MATRSQRRHEVSVISLGRYALHGSQKQIRLTIPAHAAPEFPRGVDTEVEIRKIKPDEGDAYLEVHPVDIPDDGGD